MANFLFSAGEGFFVVIGDAVIFMRPFSSVACWNNGELNAFFVFFFIDLAFMEVGVFVGVGGQTLGVYILG